MHNCTTVCCVPATTSSSFHKGGPGPGERAGVAGGHMDREAAAAQARMSPEPPRPACRQRGRLCGLAAAPHPRRVTVEPCCWPWAGPGVPAAWNGRSRGLSSLGLAGAPCGMWVAPAGSSPGGGGVGDTESLSSKPSQTPDPAPAPQSVGGSCWSMVSNVRGELPDQRFASWAGSQLWPGHDELGG